MADDSDDNTTTIRILHRKQLIITKAQASIQWLIGSPFLPNLTIVSTIRCIHTLQSHPLSPDFPKESDDMRALLPRGFEVIGALIVGISDSNVEKSARDAIDASSRMRKALLQLEKCSLVGGVVDPSSGDVRFFVLNNVVVEPVKLVVYEDEPEKYVWERGCLLYCEVPIKLPVYYSAKDSKDAEDMLTRATETVAARFRDSKTTYVIETLNESVTEAPQPVIIRNKELDLPTESNAKSLLCSHFCSKDSNKTHSAENADKIQVSFLLATSGAYLKPAAPLAEYFPGSPGES